MREGGVSSTEPRGRSFRRQSRSLRPSLSRLLNGPWFCTLLAGGDLLALTGATVQATLLIDAPVGSASHELLYTLPVAGALLISARDGYRKRLRYAFLDDLGHVVGAVSVAAMLIVVASIAIDIDARPGRIVTLAWVFAVAYVVAGRMLLTLAQRTARTRYGVTEPAIIVGAGLVGTRIARRLEDSPEYGLHAAAYLDANPRHDSHRELGAPLLGSPRELGEAIERTGARHVIVAFSSDSDRDLLEVARRSQALGVDISVVPRFFESVCDRMRLEHLAGLPLVSMRRVDPRGWQFAVKHAADRVAAGLLLAGLSPVLLAIAAAVGGTSRGPIVFRQRRVGRDGRAFDLLKFRSMRVAGDVAGVETRFHPPSGTAPGGVEGADRRTRVGRVLRKTSLDELPQLINVLRGEMSLIGPRPERPEFVKLFGLHLERYGDRQRVKAGLTGWAQVHGLRGQTSLADRVEWDNAYIDNWSLWLDLKILAMTVVELLSWRGE
jgi:exopolysaccharide biosynthesis polyprenyl glycosylphosphotransferase